jgi:hypothetical protein
MTLVKTVATHEVVQATHPRPATARDEVGMAIGKAIDGALSKFSHEHDRGLRPTAASVRRFASSVLDEEIRDADLTVTPAEREQLLSQAAAVIQAFRQSELFGLPRPRTRMILINNAVGVYAQPDFWDGSSRFYEMKSYRAFPPPADVALQLRLFQLAFPGLRAILASFDRHATPVGVSLHEIPSPSESDSMAALSIAMKCGLAQGKEKVLEYVDSPTVRYSIPS